MKEYVDQLTTQWATGEEEMPIIKKTMTNQKHFNSLIDGEEIYHESDKLELIDYIVLVTVGIAVAIIVVEIVWWILV